MTLWRSDGEYIKSFSILDGCGVAMGTQENQFFFSNGGGDLHQYTLNKSKLLSNDENQRWDNHLTAWNVEPS
jgi:hypothetical protein